jgi:hypothetical protein
MMQEAKQLDREAELLGAFGWMEIHSNNKSMRSFKHEEHQERINFYFTGTLTIQAPWKRIKVYHNVDCGELEGILDSLR